MHTHTHTLWLNYIPQYKMYTAEATLIFDWEVELVRRNFKVKQVKYIKGKNVEIKHHSNILMSFVLLQS